MGSRRSSSGERLSARSEGGTFSTHAVTVARSPLLQSAGHGSLVETASGEWFLAHLARRPRCNGRSILGRETCLQRVEWTGEGWLRMAHGDSSPRELIGAPGLPDSPWPEEPARDDFSSPLLRSCYHSLRIPLDDTLMSLTERPGFLRLKGRESIGSRFRQALVARRLTTFRSSAATCVEFEPASFQQLAGIAAFYSTQSFYYLHISRDEKAGKLIGIMRCERGVISFPLEAGIPAEGCPRVHLGIDIDHERIRFRCSRDGGRWDTVGPEMDASILTDEHAQPFGFTGAFFALCCQDLSGRGRHADFDFLEVMGQDGD